jgi:hypothetical protein
MSDYEINKSPISWKFTPQPTELSRDEFWQRYNHWDMPEKFEATHGKLFWADRQRYHVLGMLIESIGVDAVKKFIAQCQTPPEIQDFDAE